MTFLWDLCGCGNYSAGGEVLRPATGRESFDGGGGEAVAGGFSTKEADAKHGLAVQGSQR